MVARHKQRQTEISRQHHFCTHSDQTWHLKTNPEYLNEVIKVMDSSIVALNEENKALLGLLENSSQSELIELKDKIAMLNKHAFGGSESLNKHRPRRDTQRELLPHNKSPLEGEVAPDKQREFPIVEVVQVVIVLILKRSQGFMKSRKRLTFGHS